MIPTEPCAHHTIVGRQNRLRSIHSLLASLYQVGASGVLWLTRRTDLQVWQRCASPFRKLRSSRTNCYWQAFDPKTGQSFSSPSEAEMRQWIEQHY